MKGEIYPFTNLYFNSTVIFLARLVVVYFLILTLYNTFLWDGWCSLHYLTNWGHIVTTTLYVSLFFHNLFNVKSGSLLTDITSILMHMAASMQFLIFVFFWGVLSFNDFETIFNYEDPKAQRYYFVASVIKHLVNPALVWIPLLMNRTEFKRSNFYFCTVLAVAYMFSNMVITKSTGTPIYFVLNWNTTISHVYCCVALVLYFIGYSLALRISEGITEKAGFNFEEVRDIISPTARVGRSKASNHKKERKQL